MLKNHSVYNSLNTTVRYTICVRCAWRTHRNDYYFLLYDNYYYYRIHIIYTWTRRDSRRINIPIYCMICQPFGELLYIHIFWTRSHCAQTVYIQRKGERERESERVMALWRKIIGSNNVWLIATLAAVFAPSVKKKKYIQSTLVHRNIQIIVRTHIK